MRQSIEITPEFEKALNLLENTSQHVFLTGKAGTGKSTFLDYFRRTTSKNIAVVAPTGVAAVNVKGETIHSFFGFRPDITPDKVRTSKHRAKVLRRLDTLVIDEISMVRADLLDCIDKSLRLHREEPSLPFGGVQMIFIGDLYQLPPVIKGKEREVFQGYYQSGYFFHAHVFKELEVEFIELEKIYRQKDPQFIKILNAIRNNTVTEEDLSLLNQRVRKDIKIEDLPYYIFLTSTNQTAERINQRQLEKINAPLHILEGEIGGEFQEKYLPTDYRLPLKEGAQVMLLNNDELGRWVNGTLGKVVKIEEGEEPAVLVELPEGNIEPVYPFKWELFHFQWNEKEGKVESKAIGYFIQYPLKLAWAITIHKSQGKTFDRVVIDISGGIFAPGQIYVALSRCQTLEGIILTQPIERKHIFLDREIVRFLTHFQYQRSEKKLPLKEKVRIIEKAIRERSPLLITYLKPTDEKTKRIIHPLRVGEMQYRGKPFLGVEAYCEKRGEKRIFRVDRILKIDPLP